jgi:hypothetical protein
MDRGETAAPAADGRSNRVDDVSFRHRCVI